MIPTSARRTVENKHRGSGGRPLQSSHLAEVRSDIIVEYFQLWRFCWLIQMIWGDFFLLPKHGPEDEALRAGAGEVWSLAQEVFEVLDVPAVNFFITSLENNQLLHDLIVFYKTIQNPGVKIIKTDCHKVTGHLHQDCILPPPLLLPIPLLDSEECSLFPPSYW